jgi:hypothetical protein
MVTWSKRTEPQSGSGNVWSDAKRFQTVER